MVAQAGRGASSEGEDATAEAAETGAVNIAEAIRLHLEEGMSLAAVGRQFGCSAATIRRKLQRAGVATRSSSRGWAPGRKRAA
jgi:DNA-directed RNA polymerase specialized sigma24 family protein